MNNVFERVAALQREGHTFAVATVVARRAPVSAHLGDRAIVFADGRMEGFVGGACAREIVRRQALESLQARHGRLVSIRPDASAATASSSEHVVVPMTCASEGAVDVYIEPFVRARVLVVVGATPVADALARLARGMEYQVTRVIDARERADLGTDATALGVRLATLDALEAILGENAADMAVVVASQGHYDEEAVEAGLKSRAPYVGLVASRTRGSTIRAVLEERSVAGLETLRSPAGLDLGARTAPEVALSILAEIVQTRPSGIAEPRNHGTPEPRNPPSLGPAVAPSDDEAGPRTSAIDPVCGMSVDVATARHTADVDGITYYFCGANCRARFVKQAHDDPRAGSSP